MDTAMTLNWLEMRRISNARARLDDQARILTLTRENARLAEENNKLRQQFQDLSASTDIWIRLYEAALERANGVVKGMSAQPSNLMN
jgi:cell division protein FtsB